MTICSPGITDHVAMDEDEGDDEMVERDERRDSFEISPITPVGILHRNSLSNRFICFPSVFHLFSSVFSKTDEQSFGIYW